MSLLGGLWKKKQGASIALYSHFHRPFAYDTTSSWIHPVSFMDDLSGSGIPLLPRGPGSVEDFRHYMPGMEDVRFAKMFGQQALEYWLYKKAPKTDFIGCATYRRYLMIAGAYAGPHHRLIVEPRPDILSDLGSDQHRNAALMYLQSADVITNRSYALESTIEQQYLDSQPAAYWHLMMRAIETLYPQYKPHMLWFRDYNVVQFETTYIMRRAAFMKYASELFAILDYVFQHAEVVVPDEVPGMPHQPYRYPGFLGERFFPFFLYANALRTIEVPLVFVGDGT
jgi:hypothetical protein